MVLFIFVIPYILSYINKYDYKCIFKAYDLYPLFITEIVHIFFQINALLGVYTYIKYSPIIKSLFNILLILPILRRKLFYPGIGGSFCSIFGTILNKIVISANAGKMPVFPSISKYTGFCNEATLLQGLDNLHVLMNDSTKLKFLCDYIDLGFCIMSIGDVFIHLFVSIIVFYTIKDMNQLKNKQYIRKE